MDDKSQKRLFLSLSLRSDAVIQKECADCCSNDLYCNVNEENGHLAHNY